MLASVEDEADASAAKGLIEEVGNDEEEFEGEFFFEDDVILHESRYLTHIIYFLESDESDTEGLRNLLRRVFIFHQSHWLLHFELSYWLSDLKKRLKNLKS